MSEGQKTFLVVSSDSIGKDDDIGKVLVSGFFKTMQANKQAPQSIFFLNAGVRLTTQNQETIEILKDLESQGIEIFSCGTCLKHYGLEDTLQVGMRGSTDILLGGVLEDERVVWI